MFDAFLHLYFALPIHIFALAGADTTPTGASVPIVPVKGALTFNEAGQDFRGFMSHPLGKQ